LAAVMELEKITVPEIATKQLVIANVAPDIVERALAAKYPVVHIYTQSVSNTLREKFRTFSGQAHMAVEVRASQDRLEGLEVALQIYTDAVTRVLDANRGDWSDGVFYAGGYEVEFGAVKHGGKNFLQIAKVLFQMEVSI
ncbi:MAG: hypothetical protein ACRD96_13525, partial [Bryobacteraceae bacterium]